MKRMWASGRFSERAGSGSYSCCQAASVSVHVSVQPVVWKGNGDGLTLEGVGGASDCVCGREWVFNVAVLAAVNLTIRIQCNKK